MTWRVLDQFIVIEVRSLPEVLIELPGPNPLTAARESQGGDSVTLKSNSAIAGPRRSPANADEKPTLRKGSR